MSLTRAQRAALFFVSASAYLAWYSGFGERLEAQDIVGRPTPSLTIVARAVPPQVSTVIVRDPFAGSPGRQTDISRASSAGVDAAAATTVPNSSVANAPPSEGASAGGESTTTLVPDIARGRDTAAAMTLVVRATIVGRNPVAYVANGSTMDIVRIGDRLGDRRVAEIDIRGIAFSDGTRLDLPGAFVATPRPETTGTAVTIKLDDLRRLLSKPISPARPLAPAALPPNGAPVAATPFATGIFPSPGPLPTIDARGIPVGTNPTPDVNGPTPFPNPYPYAPPAPPHH